MPRNHATTQPRNHATTQPRNHATTQPRNHATTQPRNHATTQPRNHATTQRYNYKYQKLLLRLLKGQLFKNAITQSLLTSLPLLLALPASAAITTTKSTIIGTAPYLTFDGGITKEGDTRKLLSITLSDGRVYSLENNDSTPTNPIELPVEGQTLADVQMFMPIDKTSITLNELIAEPYNYWGDDDGDGINGISATGTLTMQISDAEDRTVKRDDKLNACVAYYKITFNNSAGSLKTQYGSPNTVTFPATTATYYIKPKLPTKPYACYAQPNLSGRGGSYDGPASQWDNKKGFKPQDINVPSSNFPTMGAYGLFFNLTIANGGNWQNVSYDKTPANSGIDIAISGGSTSSTNIAKILLNGPRYNTNNATTAVPTTFTLYSDKAKTNKIYSFTIDKWFIATPGDGGGYKADYCTNRYGSGYRIPSVREYTNANGYGWTGGLSGQPNNYQRRIGGGLFAEWGYTYNGSYYTGSDFDHYWYYWAVETDKQWQRYVNSNYGKVDSRYASYSDSRFACITP
ncbi:hypothetical protein PT276_05700 [Orbaceae bacterium ESL0721]|nr:hypothetical protein [Orbaceae bacterium ESL0721]